MRSARGLGISGFLDSGGYVKFRRGLYKEGLDDVVVKWAGAMTYRGDLGFWGWRATRTSLWHFLSTARGADVRVALAARCGAFCKARTGSGGTPARPRRGGTGTHRVPPPHHAHRRSSGPSPSPQVVLSYGSTSTTAASDAHPASAPLPGFRPVIRRHAPAAPPAGRWSGGRPPQFPPPPRYVPRRLRWRVPHGCTSRLYTASRPSP
jgi:hypothetical protein